MGNDHAVSQWIYNSSTYALMDSDRLKTKLTRKHYTDWKDNKICANSLWTTLKY